MNLIEYLGDKLVSSTKSRQYATLVDKLASICFLAKKGIGADKTVSIDLEPISSEAPNNIPHFIEEAMPTFAQYMPHATAEQISAIMDAVQRVSFELQKTGSDYAFDFLEVIKDWQLDESTFTLLMEHTDLHVVHDALTTLEKLYELDNIGVLRKSFGEAEKLRTSLKKMITPTKPDFIKFKCIELLASMKDDSMEVLDIIRSVKEELYRILESEQFLTGSVIVSTTLRVLGMYYTKKDPDEILLQTIKKIIAQTKVETLRQTFEKKGKAVKNVLAGNIDAFSLLLLSLRTKQNLIWTGVETFLTEVLEGKVEANFRRDIFHFSGIEADWILSLALFNSSLNFPGKFKVFLGLEWGYLGSPVELVNQWILDDKTAHYDCFDLLLRDLLQGEELFSVTSSFLLLNVIMQSAEAMGIRIVSKFVYKEEAVENTSRVVREFFLQLESGITQETVSLSPKMEHKIFYTYALLMNAVTRWGLKDLVLELPFYSKQTIISFWAELLLKSAQNLISPLAQLLIIEILQFFIIVPPDYSIMGNSIDLLASVPNKYTGAPLILSLLKRFLQEDKADTLVNRERVLEKIDLRIKQLPNPSLALNDECVSQLSKDVSKHTTASVLLYLYRFDEPFTALIPAFVQQISTYRKDRDTFSKLVQYPSKKEEEAELYKKLLEIEREEHKRDVEALTMGLMQAEGEIQVLKCESINSVAMADSLRKQVEEFRRVVAGISDNKTSEIELRLEVARNKGEIEALKKKNKLLEEKVTTLLEIIGATEEGEKFEIIAPAREEVKAEPVVEEIKEKPKGAFVKYERKMSEAGKSPSVSKGKKEFKKVVDLYTALWNKQLA